MTNRAVIRVPAYLPIYTSDFEFRCHPFGPRNFREKMEVSPACFKAGNSRSKPSLLPEEGSDGENYPIWHHRGSLQQPTTGTRKRAQRRLPDEPQPLQLNVFHHLSLFEQVTAARFAIALSAPDSHANSLRATIMSIRMCSYFRCRIPLGRAGTRRDNPMHSVASFRCSLAKRI